MVVGGHSVHFPACTILTSSGLRPNITIFFTLLAVGVSFAWLGVDEPAQWRAGVALYILGCESFKPL